jgi:hypothetical protein
MNIVFMLFLVFLFLILASAPIIVFISGIVKKTIRWSSFAFNLVVFIHSVILLWLIAFVLPKNQMNLGSFNDAWLPAIIGSLAFAAAILSLSYKQSPPPSAPVKASRSRWPLLARWVLLIGGELAYLYWLLITLHFANVPEWAQQNGEKIIGLVYSLIISSFAGCALCYVASRFNSVKRRNLMRWVVLGSSYTGLSHSPMVIALSLVVPHPNTPGFIYSHAASLLMLAYLPLIALFTLLAKDFQKHETAGAIRPKALRRPRESEALAELPRA